MPDTRLISVITPFHNTADYLERCITSVLNQTYKHFEYLLCDNCSTDGSLEIAQAFAARDPRIRLVRFDELLPQVANYNRALALIDPNAEWCKIVQADDWIYEQCLDRMIRVGNLDEKIGLVSAYQLKGNAVVGTGLPSDTEVFDGQEVCRYQLLDGLFFVGSPSAVMYRAKIVRSRQPFYTLNRYHEDTEVAYEILEHHKFGFVHEILSFLRVGNPSIMTSRATFNTFILDRLIAIERYAHRFVSSGDAKRLRRTARRRYFMFLGESALRLRSRDFWAYHREGLATIDWNWSWARVFVGATLAIVKMLLEPFLTAKRIWRYARQETLNRS